MLFTLVIGLIVGIVAKFFMPGREPSGFILTILLGIGGAMFANYIGAFLGFYTQGQPVGFIASVLGAMGILAIYQLFTSSKRTN